MLFCVIFTKSQEINVVSQTRYKSSKVSSEKILKKTVCGEVLLKNAPLHISFMYF